MRRKISVPPCRYCNKHFQRTEHLTRHERTHTKEKPFICPCGQSFSRRDLLSRHEKIAHDGLSGAVLTSPVPSSSAPDQSSLENAGLTTMSVIPPAPGHTNSADTAPQGVNHDISELHEPNPSIDHQTFDIQNSQNAQHMTENTNFMQSSNTLTSATDYLNPSQTSWDDLDFLWDAVDSNSNFLQPASFSPSYPMNLLMFSHYGIASSEHTEQTGQSPINDSQQFLAQMIPDDPGSISRYGSRLPSLQPDVEPQTSAPGLVNSGLRTGQQSLPSADSSQPHTPWRTSHLQYRLAEANILEHTSALPTDFMFPTRHALNRYIEGYFSGFHEHLPFLHPQTFAVEAVAPELVLAILSMGAQYRFQRIQAHHLYVAARALVERRIRQRDGYGPPPSALKTPSTLSDGTRHGYSPVANRGTSADPIENPRRGYSTTPLDDSPDARIQTMQAMILLIAHGTWNHRSLLKDSLALGSQLALLVREHGMSEAKTAQTAPTWQDWLLLEEARRTKLVAYCFLNLHSIAYNIPPKLMNSEIKLDLPCPEVQWRASNSEEWKRQCTGDLLKNISFRDGFTALFSDSNGQINTSTKSFHSFGNYVLVHSILQQIFFARQSSTSFGLSNGSQLPPDTLSRLETALRRWQRQWDSAKDSSLDPSSPSGPLSFNAVALFRIAYIRLYTDLGPCRQLESRNASTIAQAFMDIPDFPRTTHVCRAALQCAHALSLPIRIGIEYVARTQTLTWSIVHSLCNLECAIFLSQWIKFMSNQVALGPAMINQNELRLLNLTGSILGESDLGASIERETTDSRRYKRMAAAVVRLWAETFKGAHVFEIMGTIGAALELHANALDEELISRT